MGYYYGGGTLTHALTSTSPAINAGNNCVVTLTCASNNPPSALTADQRGAGRIGAVDIGAFELNSSQNSGSYVAALPNATQNSSYSFTLAPNNVLNGATFAYSKSAGTLPNGVTLTTTNNVVTLSGTPTQTGTFNFSVTATDGTNTNITDYSLQVNGSATTYAISGHVTNGGQGLQGVTITLSGSASASTTTDASGNYTLSGVAGGGSYAVTPSLSGYSFTPLNSPFSNLAANQTNVNFATSTVSYEGDVAGRTSGDGAINVLDLVAVGNMIAGNTVNGVSPAPQTAAEFQRADCAPRTAQDGMTLLLGDGKIDVNDLVQIGRYAAGLDPRTLAGGPTAAAPPIAMNGKDGAASKVGAEAAANTVAAGSVTASNGAAGGAANVPVNLTTDGTIEAIQFTITYDATKLSLASQASIINRYPNTTFTFNTSTPGKIGVVANQPLDGSSVFPAGTDKFFDINFTVVAGATGQTSVDFSDTPVARAASSPQAQPVSFTTQAGTVTIPSPTATNVSISGVITDANNQPLAGVGVRLGGAGAHTTVTDAAGRYSFADLSPSGFYTVTPILGGLKFAPESRAFSLKRNVPDAVFSGAPDGTNANPLNTPEFFVRQQYLDFLNREPDQPGVEFWSQQLYAQLAACAANDAACQDEAQARVSAAYFLSIEFQETGYLVHRLYKASFGRAPRYAEFIPNTREIGQGVVVNADGWQAKLEANTQTFINEFVNRDAFKQTYPDAMSAAEYVDALNRNAGGTLTADARNALIVGLTAGTQTRASVLRSVAENDAFTKAEFDRAFVLMQYFGYLRRDSDDPPDNNLTGYQFWLNKLNAAGGDYIKSEMVKSFIVSQEYRARFASPK